MTNTNAAESRVALALGVVDRALHALRAARVELVRLDADRERELDAALDAAMADENEVRADQLADEAQRRDDAQDGLQAALWAVESTIDVLRTDARAPLRRSANRLRPPAPGALDCLAEIGGRR